MGRFPCKCGHLFTNTFDPDKQLNYLVNDVALTNESDFGEKLVKFLKEDSKLHSDAAALEEFFVEEVLRHASAELYRCPKCGRVYIEKSKDSWDFQCYTPEQEDCQSHSGDK